MGKGSKMVLLLVCLFSLLITAGCWGARETDELGYVLSLGIDKGVENVIQVTFQIAIPQSPEGGGGGDKENNIVVSVEAASLFGALQLANSFVSRELTLIHNRAVIVSEEIAREGISKYLEPLVRSRDIRRNTFFLVTRGKAKEFVESNQPLLERNAARDFELLLAGRKVVGFIPDSIINDIHRSVNDYGREAIIALVGVNNGKEGEEKQEDYQTIVKSEMALSPNEVPREGGNKIEAIGLAAFRGDRLKGYLNGLETGYYQMITGDFKSAIYSFPDPEKSDEYLIVVKVTKGRNPQFKVVFEEGKVVPSFEVTLVLEGEILSIQSGLEYEKGSKEKELEEYLARYLASGANDVIKKTQNELACDIFGLGDKLRKYFWTFQEWKDYNWLEKYPSAEVNVKVNFMIRRTGLLS